MTLVSSCLGILSAYPGPAGPILRFKLSGTDPMVSAEREPITGVYGGAPSGVQGQSPLVRGSGSNFIKLTVNLTNFDAFIGG